MYQEFKESVGIAYERFLMRDLTYVFAGIILLVCVTYAFYGNVDIIIGFLSKNCNWCLFILFLIASYFIGLIAKEGLQLIRCNKKPVIFTTIPTYPTPFEDDKKGSLLLKRVINKKYGLDTTRELERTIYFFHVGASIGSASILSLIILVLSLLTRVNNMFSSVSHPEIYGLLIFVLGVTYIACKKENTWKINQYNEQLERLVKDIFERENEKWLKKEFPTLTKYLN